MRKVLAFCSATPYAETVSKNGRPLAAIFDARDSDADHAVASSAGSCGASLSEEREFYLAIPRRHHILTLPPTRRRTGFVGQCLADGVLDGEPSGETHLRVKAMFRG